MNAEPKRQSFHRSCRSDRGLRIVELLFFAYRDFTADADLRLSEDGFGRAHHRVMHFVGRQPGLSVAELLELLRITKQSLGRVLKQLIDGGYVNQRISHDDRRRRELFLTEKGEAMIATLTEPQIARIERALSTLPETEREAVGHFLSAMIDHEGRDQLQRIDETGQS